MVVKTNLWPALQSCKRRCYDPNDRISRLPDDLLIIILSFLTIKDAARTSVLSHRWIYLSRYIPVLVIEDLSSLKRIFTYKYNECAFQERLNFVKWVNRVVETHRCPYVDELRLTFDLDKSCQSDVDNWLLFAIAKQVKRLELNFAPPDVTLAKDHLLKWRIPFDLPQNLSFFKSCLRSLSLKFVKVTTNDVECLLRSCMVLESFCIHSSPALKCVGASGLPLQLKHLEVSDCIHLEVIDILAPKLLSFKHGKKRVELRIRGASRLSKLSLGYICCFEDIVAHVFDSLSMYVSQLEYFSWQIRMFHCGDRADNCVQYNLEINNPPAMKNLKHLDLDFCALCDQSVLGWADLIDACPLLERLTLRFLDMDGNHSRKIMTRIGRPIKSLKALELYGELLLPIDLEFVM